MREFANLAEMQAVVGQEVVVSDWIAIPQERINLFADATDDQQWIHIEPERCARDSPFGKPIAHGFLTLSMLPALFEKSIGMRDTSMVINYGLNKVRFPAPVPVDSRIRARFTLAKIEQFPGFAQLEWHVEVESENSSKPVCVAELLLRRYP